MKLVIVESPAKAKTINKYLGPDYKVLASYGHVRDLPSKKGMIEPENGFKFHWAADTRGRERIKEIAAAAKNADQIILATDPDREGEAISWHLLDELHKKKLLKDRNVSRVAFNAITKKAVMDAIRSPRQIDDKLVEAYLARRAVDYLLGFTLSPVLWTRLPGARSAGRVQSVTLRLVCEREEEIERFKPQEYWNVGALYEAKNGQFEARLSGWNGDKIGRLDVPNGEMASNVKQMLEAADHRIVSVEAKPVNRNPYAPFTTSTLQQDASSKLGFNASRTMSVAQRLYEAGHITYMRTDGVQMAPEAIEQVRGVIGDRFGKLYLPEKPRFYSSKAKNAQEAHEAIRPTNLGADPASLGLEDEQRRLYDLIWKRTLAAQMASAKMERTTVEIEATHRDDRAALRATGSVIKFDGFLKVYAVKKTDDEEERNLPPVAENESVEAKTVTATQHFTEPPARYSEAALIRKLEELGIGRPSTYASTLQTLQDREYVIVDKRRLMPTDKGRVLTPFLTNFFARYVDYDFTADLEQQLDRISAGELDWKSVLDRFWKDLRQAVDDIEDVRVAQVIDRLNEVLGDYLFPTLEDGTDTRTCPRCGEGELGLKLSKNGGFIGCSRYPECNYTRQLGDFSEDALKDAKPQAGIIGTDPDTGKEIELRDGRFGPYLVRGGDSKDNASIPKSFDAEAVTLEQAVKLFSLPRHVGDHPETGLPIETRFGRYGPVLIHDGKFTGLEADADVFEIGMNKAIDLIANPPRRGRGGASSPSKAAIADLGEHPELGGKVQVLDGRYGPYVKWEKINATIPKGRDPKEVGIAEAVDLIKARAEKAGKTLKRTGAKKPASKRKPAARKPRAKKADA